MHLAPGGNAQNRRPLPQRIDQIPGSAVTAGEQDHLRTCAFQSLCRPAGVLWTTGHGGLADDLTGQSGLPAACFPHLAGPGQYGQVLRVGKRLQRACHAGRRLGLGTASQRFVTGFLAIATLQCHAATEPRVGIYQNTETETFVDFHKAVISRYKNGIAVHGGQRLNKRLNHADSKGCSHEPRQPATRQEFPRWRHH